MQKSRQKEKADERIPEKGCSHMSVIDNDQLVLDNFNAICLWVFSQRRRDLAVLKKSAKAQNSEHPRLSCRTCSSSLNRIFLCLHCTFAGCIKERHINEHAESTNHSLGNH
jgi:ubiquitin carboxyl-terminal hydrolase 22/27/51